MRQAAILRDFRASIQGESAGEIPSCAALVSGGTVAIVLDLVAAALEMAGPNPTRADMLQLINDVGRFDISGGIITFGQKMHDVPAKVFLTVIQPDGTFKAVDRL